MLGDFGGLRHNKQLPVTVVNGLNNHYLVDKFTDSHDIIKATKSCFSTQRKRFSGIAIDVLFDHFLIKHWQQFHSQPLTTFKKHSYQLLNERVDEMPERMQRVVSSMTRNDWFKEYETLSGLGIALDNIAKRIRFKNNFAGSIEEIDLHYATLEEAFLAFFPLLIAHVKLHELEVK